MHLCRKNLIISTIYFLKSGILFRFTFSFMLGIAVAEDEECIC